MTRCGDRSSDVKVRDSRIVYRGWSTEQGALVSAQVAVSPATSVARPCFRPRVNRTPLEKISSLLILHHCVRPRRLCSATVVFTKLSPVAPSMFGRDLVEQVKADARGTDRAIPVIVEKCIEAVETLGKLQVSCSPGWLLNAIGRCHCSDGL